MRQAIGNINVSTLSEIKSMQAPPSQLISLGKAFLIIFGEKIDERHVWNDFKVLLGKKAAFIENVSSGPEECPSKALINLKPLFLDPNFNIEKMRNINSNADELLEYVRAWYDWQKIRAKIASRTKVYELQ